MTSRTSIQGPFRTRSKAITIQTRFGRAEAIYESVLIRYTSRTIRRWQIKFPHAPFACGPLTKQKIRRAFL